MVSSTALLSALPFPACVLDSDGEILAANPAIQTVTGIPAPRVVGTPFFEALHHLGGIGEAQQTFARGFPSESFHESFQVTYADGAEVVPMRYRLRLHAFVEDEEIFAIGLFELIAGDDLLRREIHGLEDKLSRVRTFKHDISNNLMGLMGHSELLRETPGLPDPVRARAGRLMDQCQKIREAVEGIGETLGARRPPS